MIRLVLARAIRLARRRPSLLIPFALLTLTELYLMMVAILRPDPLGAVDAALRHLMAAAPVRAVLGLLALPRLFDYDYFVVLLRLFAAPLMFGWALAILERSLRREGRRGVLKSLRSAGRRYPALFAANALSLFIASNGVHGLMLVFEQAIEHSSLRAGRFLSTTFLVVSTTLIELVALVAVEWMAVMMLQEGTLVRSLPIAGRAARAYKRAFVLAGLFPWVLTLGLVFLRAPILAQTYRGAHPLLVFSGSVGLIAIAAYIRTISVAVFVIESFAAAPHQTPSKTSTRPAKIESTSPGVPSLVS